MGIRDPRIDAYVDGSADFAKPILEHIREIVHGACPDVEETMKWSFPHFTYHGVLCSMASFKAHCAFGFWKSSLVLDGPGDDAAMGQFGRITSVKDLPGKRAMTAYVKKAAKLNLDGVKAPRVVKARTPRPLEIPADLAKALERHRAALDTFDAFSPSHKREYVEWITEAKRDETRKKRVAQTLEMLSEGKTRNWNYEKR